VFFGWIFIRWIYSSGFFWLDFHPLDLLLFWLDYNPLYFLNIQWKNFQCKKKKIGMWYAM
jgi:hypothetical protein